MKAERRNEQSRNKNKKTKHDCATGYTLEPIFLSELEKNWKRTVRGWF